MLFNILSDLVGRGNVYAARMSTFGGGHMDEDLATRKLVLVPDARGSTRADHAALEFILTFTGEDEINFSRKYKSNWRGYPLGKLAVATNEIIGLQDSSDALASRALILQRRTSFVDAEDTGLLAGLKAELRSIFFWALEGLDRLEARGRFDKAAMSEELRKSFKYLSNPVADFLARHYLKAPDGRIGVQGFYEAWEHWCRSTGTINNLRQIKFVAAVRQQAPEVREVEGEGGERFLVGLKPR